MLFFDFGIKDVIDIFLVALILYSVYQIMKKSSSLHVFYGVLLFVLIWIFVSQIVEMKLLGTILDKLISVGVLALIILFQEEIRRFLYTIGVNHRLSNLFSKLGKNKHASVSRADIMPLVMACMNMGKQRVGALIVIEQDVPLADIISTGELVDATISQRLIESVFFKNSPLHDGAMVISNKRIKAASCILPVSHSMAIPKELGLRHRAAFGLSQEADALAVIVSEETGGISVAHKGVLKLYLNAEELERILSSHKL